ncbi:hypothetical protein ACJMK2_042674 [Sinanodonta woodiana]|uniref:Uncharacterized protein n=1 Tax=Sinanodonta woodiana TaxID=1069815 RepID=A0ABD3W860_SINWO
MAEFRLKFSVAMVLAIVLSEAASFLWYGHYSPWHGHAGERYLLTALIADVVLVTIIQWIMAKYWSVRRIQDAAVLSTWLVLFYVSLQAPHAVYGLHHVSWFVFNGMHKFVQVFVISASLFYFRDY